MAKITNEMATNLTLDVSKAKGSLKELTDAVKTSNNEWKIQESQLKAAGDTANASKARYEGLSNTVDQQKTKVQALKTALENNNTTTEKGQKLQTYLTQELAKAERQLGSYQGQLDKATQSYKYQESGLASLNKEIDRGNQLTDARVRKLEAEGRTEDAQRTRLQNLHSLNANYNKILDIQKDELSKLASSGEKNSDAYKKQDLRIEQMSAKIAETTSKIKALNSEGIHVNTTQLSAARNQVERMNEQLKKANGRFKSMFMANIAATGITSSLASVKNSLTNVVSAGADYNKTMQNIQVGLDNFTNGNTTLSKQLLENVKTIKTASGYSEDTVALLTKKTYGITNSVEGTEKLSKAFVNLGRATGKSDEQMNTLVTRFSQMNASGEITSASLTKMEKQLPGFRKNLAETMHVSQDELSKLASSGKLSMQDLSAAIEHMSDSKPKGLDNYYKTVDGFTTHLKDRYKELSGTITAGFFNNSNTMLASISKSLDGKEVDAAFNRFGDAVNKSANTIFGAFSKTFGKEKNPVVGFADSASVSVEKFGNFIAKHSDDIKNFFEMVKNLSKAGFGVMGATLKAALPLLEALGSFASKHPTTFKVLAGSVLAFNLAIKGTMAAFRGFDTVMIGITAMKKFGAALGIAGKAKSAATAIKSVGLALKGALIGNPIGLIITGVTLLGFAFYELYKHNAKFKKFVDGIFKEFSKFGKSIGKIASSAGKAITKGFNSVVNFFKKNWKELGVYLINPFAGALNTLYKHNKTFRKGVDSLFEWFKDMLKGIVKFFSGIMDSIGDAWTSAWDNISDFFHGLWNGLSKFINKSFNAISDSISDVLSNIGKTWNNMWQGLSDFFAQIWNNIKGFAQDGINGVLSVINAGVDAIDSVWKFFTGHETSIHHLKPVKFERGGIVETRMSMINDGKGENWKELLQLPNGEFKMSNKRDHVLPLPVGTRVYNGEQTKQIMNAAGIQKYADGGIVGGLIDWGKGAFKDVSSWIGDKYEAVVGFLKDPIKNVTNMISKATSGMYENLHSFGEMAHGVWDNLTEPISEWFKKELDKIKEEMKRSAPAGTGVERWRSQVIDALKANGMSTESWAVEKILRQISSESSGNEKAVQGGYTDVNTLSGDLAKGLMQTISATFNAYAFPGHNDIFNGYDNLLASIAYIKSRYGYGMSGIGEGHGYANGGLITQHQLAQVGEGNKPEMIIPLDSMKSSRGFELLGKTAAAMAARDGMQQQTNVNVDNAEVVNELKNVSQLLMAILGVGKDQLTSMNSKPGNLNNLYQQIARDNSMRGYQSI